MKAPMLIVLLYILCIDHYGIEAKVQLPPDKSKDVAQHHNDPITAVVIAAVGRTGSTLISALFKMLPGVFVIVEPYKKFLRINLSDPKSPPAPGVPIPTLASLLDCSFARSLTTVRALAWGFLCMHSKLTDSDYDQAGFFERCKDPTKLVQEDVDAIYQYCMRSNVRVVKTIRFAQAGKSVIRSLQTLNTKKNMLVRVLHVIRHPFQVMISQYKHAWYETVRLRNCEGRSTCNHTHEPLNLTEAQAEIVAKSLVPIGGHVCELMTNVTNEMAALDLGLACQVIRHEDLAAPYSLSSFQAIMAFLGISSFFPPQMVASKLEYNIQRSVAGFKITGWEYREAQVEAASKLGTTQTNVAKLQQCKEFYSLYNYRDFPA
eukprot:m.77005 g.77005  ORF g.77005 m.77005 type:complete len:375 (-) comp12595_c0_seq4:39-1163(-)